MVEAVAIPAPVCVWMRCGDMGPPARDDGGWYTSIGTQRRCLEHAGWSDTEGYCWGEIILVSDGAADADDERRGDALKRLGVIQAAKGKNGWSEQYAAIFSVVDAALYTYQA